MEWNELLIFTRFLKEFTRVCGMSFKSRILNELNS